MFTLFWTEPNIPDADVSGPSCQLCPLQPKLGRTSSGKKPRSAQVTKQNTDGGRVFLALCVWNRFMYLSYLDDFRITVLNLLKIIYIQVTNSQNGKLFN